MKNLLLYIKKALLTGIIAFAVIFTATATTWFTDAVNGDIANPGTRSNPLDSIQNAIAKSSNGDTIVVLDADYLITAPINTVNKKIVIKSDLGYNSSTITDQGSGIWAFIINSGEGNATTIEGFTIYTTRGIYVSSSSPTIANCYFNVTDSAIYSTGILSPVVQNNIIITSFGDGVFFSGNNNANIINNTIYSYSNSSNGTGINNDGSSGSIENNIIDGFLTGISYSKGFPSFFKYNDVWGNSTDYNFSDKPNFDGQKNISIDPSFADFDSYVLSDVSPCINAGDPAMKDPNGSAIEIGAVPYVGNNNCKAGFTINKLNDTTFQFINTSTNSDSATWYVDGGDPIFDSLKSLTYSFPYAGDHTVELNINSITGCNDASYQSVTINDLDCHGDFYSEAIDSLKVRFYGYYSNVNNKTVTWNWDFGDGNTLVIKNDTLNTDTVDHFYKNGAGDYNVTLSITGDVCTSSITYSVNASDVFCPTPVISMVKHIGNDTIVFSASGKATSYNWQVYGDYGSNYFQTTDSVFKFGFPSDGNYSVYVNTVNDNNGCNNWSYPYEIMVGDTACSAYWTAYPVKDSLFLDYYVETYQYPGREYIWDFGDGYTSRDSAGRYTYRDSGVYTVKLLVNNKAANCKSSFSKDITIGNVQCVADFNIESQTGNTVNFNSSNSGTKGATYFYWDFGDGGYSTDANPDYTYEESGKYDVYLSVWNDGGCYNYTFKTIVVGDVSALTIADFDYFVATDNLTVQFTNKSSKSVSEYYWTFGDGYDDESENPNHVYEIQDYYTACLSVYNDENGNSDYICKDIQVGSSDCNLIAAYKYVPDTTNLKVSFYNQSLGDYDKYYWDFGDGNTDSVADPVNQYSQPGYYVVSLSVRKTGSECSSIYFDFIVIGTLDCKANFDYSVDKKLQQVTFKDKSKGAVYYYWYFDDGYYSEEQNPVHTFDDPGMHYVSLTTSDSIGMCTDYYEKEIQVGEVSCSAHFSYYVNISTNTAFCKNEVIGKSTDFNWYFGDGTESTDTNPTHSFDYPGYYTIGLSTYDEVTGCMDYYETTVLIGKSGDDCEANFYYRADSSKSVNFSDNSKGTIIDHVWDFGDGIVVTDTAPSHTYNKGGHYNVCLTVVNDHGISNITCKDIVVAATPKTDCKAKFVYTVDSAKKSVSFVDKSIGVDSITKFVWNFDIPGDSTIMPPFNYQFDTAGLYLISLHITTAAGCLGKDYHLINIGKTNVGLQARFGSESQDFSTKAGGYPVDFIGAGLGDQSRLKWNFGDNSVDTTSSTPTHIFLKAGTYYVCYEVSDPISGQVSKSCGNVSTTNVTTCTNDVVKPVAKCKNITITLNNSGTASINPDSVDDNSTDDCGIQIYKLSKSSFTTADIGANILDFIVIDNGGNSDTCKTTVTVQKGTAVHNPNLVSGFTVYPNPFNDNLTISYYLLENSNVDLSIFDMLGKRVALVSTLRQSAGARSANFDASGIDAGTYILQLRTSNGFISKQAIVKK